VSFNIKRVIREELARISETETKVFYPDFGGGRRGGAGGGGSRGPSDLERALEMVKDAIEEIIEDEAPGMDSNANDMLHELLDYVDELYDKAVGGPRKGEEKPYGAPATDRERRELGRFKLFARDRDDNGDF
jgi:hypothetical protein